MGIDANFRFNIPVDADFPDDVTLERDPAETRVYLHPGILAETEKELKAALDGQDQYREQLRGVADALGLATTESERLRRQIEASAGLKCPNCDDVGWYIGSYQDRHGDECPEQIQCEFCEVIPDSIFNRKALQSAGDPLPERKFSDPCKCTFSQKMVGDGCELCNPRKAAETVGDSLPEFKEVGSFSCEAEISKLDLPPELDDTGETVGESSNG